MNHYDAVPYPDNPYPPTHPSHLCAMAALLGLEAPRPEKARVLEIGSASGTNLASMAAYMPDASFTGIDYSAAHVARSQELADKLGLDNVRFVEADLRHWSPPEDEPPFDYIIAHGVYSWVSDDVRNALMGVVKDRLAPDGVAYISYNTYPGWGIRQQIRDGLLRFSNADADVETRSAQCGLLLELLQDARTRIESDKGGAVPSRRAMRTEAKSARQALFQAPGYFFHEYLEPHNKPVWLADFVHHARQSGLRHAADANVGTWLLSDFPPDIDKSVRDMTGGDALAYDTVADMLRMTTIRCSLVVHDHHKPDPQLAVERLLGLHLSHRFVETEDGRFSHPAKPENFVAVPPGTPAQAVLQRLARALQGLPYEDFEDDPEHGAILLNAVVLGVVQARAGSMGFRSLPPERPRVNPVVRACLLGNTAVFSPRHEPVDLSDEERALLDLCDGTNSTAELEAATGAPVQAHLEKLGSLGLFG